MDKSLLLTPMDSANFLSLPHDDVNFVNLPSKYLCLIHKKVLRNASQLPCGHHICEGCIDTLFGNESTAMCPSGEEDCMEPFSKKEIFKDMCTRREVLMLEAYCSYRKHGCKEVLRLRLLRNHEDACGYQPIPCSNDGCLECVPRVQMKQHQEELCNYRPITCTHCQQSVPYCTLNKHLEEICLKVPLPCPNNCGVAAMPRTRVTEHIKSCPKAARNCAYSSIGCPFTGLEQEVTHHEKHATDQHLQLMITFSSKTNDQNIVLQQEMETLKAENIQLKSTVDQLHKDNLKMKEDVDKFSRTVGRDMKKKVANLMERQITLEQNITNLPKKDVVDRQERDLVLLKEDLAKNQERVNTLERSGLGGAAGTDPAMAAGHLAPQLKSVERQIAVQDVRIAELDLQFQVLETATYDGILMWKIKDYARRKGEAVNGRTLSLYSQPFYTSRFGYKMCGRVYLNGDGMGKGTHMSLFFVVMRGEYDALLPWPFKQKVSLMLLDQDTQTKTVCDTFQPDASSTSFIKPTSDMNIATGCPMFISHSLLETRTYLKDDTIFIKVRVDTAGLPVI